MPPANPCACSQQPANRNTRSLHLAPSSHPQKHPIPTKQTNNEEKPSSSHPFLQRLPSQQLGKPQPLFLPQPFRSANLPKLALFHPLASQRLAAGWPGDRQSTKQNFMLVAMSADRSATITNRTSLPSQKPIFAPFSILSPLPTRHSSFGIVSKNTLSDQQNFSPQPQDGISHLFYEFSAQPRPITIQFFSKPEVLFGLFFREVSKRQLILSHLLASQWLGRIHAKSRIVNKLSTDCEQP